MVMKSSQSSYLRFLMLKILDMHSCVSSDRQSSRSPSIKPLNVMYFLCCLSMLLKNLKRRVPQILGRWQNLKKTLFSIPFCFLDRWHKQLYNLCMIWISSKLKASVIFDLRLGLSGNRHSKCLNLAYWCWVFPILSISVYKFDVIINNWIEFLVFFGKEVTFVHIL